MAHFLERNFILSSRGAAPEKWMLEVGEYTMSRFAGLYGMAYGGMITDSASAVKKNSEIR